ncbi:unnamed protein product [Paramecium sonneborni]|uniref:Uncharacterized protein n=1 Tax=Paramecium sonneborni TaxID=65129 RepID=A0A8S1MKI6_9CILI|nr:unnamed protein product [Paramecium sonneborni]
MFKQQILFRLRINCFDYKNQQWCNQYHGYYYYIYLHECVSICGDRMITQNEECDDQNNFENDGCFNCKCKCQKNSLICQFGQCLECELAYKIQSFQCVPQCGNQLIQDNEICDDDNNINFDGYYFRF